MLAMSAKRMYPHLNPLESLGFHCNLTVKAFAARMSEKLKGTGVSRIQFWALVQLVDAGSLSLSELTERLFISKATGVRLVDRMERDGLVNRRTDPNDGRTKQVAMTDKAFKIWDKISLTGRELLDEAYKGIDPADIETVKQTLYRIRGNLGI